MKSSFLHELTRDWQPTGQMQIQALLATTGHNLCQADRLPLNLRRATAFQLSGRATCRKGSRVKADREGRGMNG